MRRIKTRVTLTLTTTRAIRKLTNSNSHNKPIKSISRRFRSSRQRRLQLSPCGLWFRQHWNCQVSPLVKVSQFLGFLKNYFLNYFFILKGMSIQMSKVKAIGLLLRLQRHRVLLNLFNYCWMINEHNCWRKILQGEDHCIWLLKHLIHSKYAKFCLWRILIWLKLKMERDVRLWIYSYHKT